MTYRYQYIIGDLQGCFAALQALKDALAFDEQQDCLYFAGDLVARGEDSLNTLREVKRLADLGAARTVLGNHDLNLLAVWRGFQKIKDKDRTQPIFDALDCDVLLNWLRKQPLLLQPTAGSVVVHAGIPPVWTLQQARQYAREVEKVISGELDDLDAFLSHMYGSQPDVWQEHLSGYERWRVITNYFTRMRLCDENGRLEFDFKDDLSAPMPEGFKPWFEWPDQLENQTQLFFGHWAALQGKSISSHIHALDGGCVWGGQLIAYRLEDKQFFTSATGCGL
ncbi:symmetrical bis(5'-nucleosyl)-tetraphosphatase [Alkanindiges illinoisensis]|uniref:bis(5'-nucleosyl)-tetraphosphatase (symmetrical) n=1 Tax=Alkanindiges illinoisensis TaxID=197183 RepID=A0A4Y7XGE5_9GAMM|nr:symmetrical bis(5'-nucleosyl)-tetraphosphatase [Alkanindiges illinoisensis]TEU30622.1 symmetrical bis(5'-nucleosyl)-tetraphosphatase [Alkanindiges illinoisensis]